MTEAELSELESLGASDAGYVVENNPDILRDLVAEVRRLRAQYESICSKCKNNTLDCACRNNK